MTTLRTAALLAALMALFLGVGYVLGGHGGMFIAFLAALAINVFSYWNSDKIVLRMANATEVDARSAPAYSNIVAQLTQRAGLPMPRLFIMDSPQPNAFATGRSPAHASLCATTGLLSLLDERELAGVLAHELAHVKNRDTLTMTVTATIAGAIGMLANFAQISAIFGGGNRSGGHGSLIGTLVVAFLAPLAAGIVQMAVSRSREFAADRGGAQITGHPLWLAAALGKIAAVAAQVPNDRAQRHRSLAHLFIINPLHGFGMNWLFSSHPKTEDRIAELMKLAKEMGEGDLGGFANAGGQGAGVAQNRLGLNPRGPWDDATNMPGRDGSGS